MITISSIRQLEQFGIDALTGEADSLGLRILCDLTEKGRRTVCKALELPDNTTFLPNYNSGTRSDPHIGCILLDPYQFQMIAVFALLEHGCPQVLIFDNGTVMGMEGDERVADEGKEVPDGDGYKWEPDRVVYGIGERQVWPENAYGWPRRIIHNPNGAYRNTHAMSGRVR